MTCSPLHYESMKKIVAHIRHPIPFNKMLTTPVTISYYHFQTENKQNETFSYDSFVSMHNMCMYLTEPWLNASESDTSILLFYSTEQRNSPIYKSRWFTSVTVIAVPVRMRLTDTSQIFVLASGAQGREQKRENILNSDILGS